MSHDVSFFSQVDLGMSPVLTGFRTGSTGSTQAEDRREEQGDADESTGCDVFFNILGVQNADPAIFLTPIRKVSKRSLVNTGNFIETIETKVTKDSNPRFGDVNMDQILKQHILGIGPYNKCRIPNSEYIL